MRYATPLLLLLTGLAAPADTSPKTPDLLLEELSSPDPQTRAAAADKLLALGVSARPLVLAAMHSGNPEVRARAADLILKLPWHKPTDPGEVQRVLAQYGQHDPATRAHDASLLARFSDRAGIPALARLLTEDPSESVRWSIAYQLHAVPATAADTALAPLRDLDPADQPPSVLAGMALAWRKQDLPKAQALYQQASAALLEEGAPAHQHLAFGEVLLEHGLRSLARKELETALSLPGPKQPLLEANAHFQLATLIGDSDDKAAADHIKDGIDAFNRIDGGGLTLERGPGGAGSRTEGNEALSDLRAQMHLHNFRHAKKTATPDQANDHLTKLLALKPSRADVVLEIVPALKSLGRNDEALAMFERAYKPLKSATETDPANPEHLNNLAWLCTRCGENIDEAVKLSTRALELSPDNPAYLDTAADAHFSAGNKQKAVELESRALELRPGDEFMLQQLKRFQSSSPSKDK